VCFRQEINEGITLKHGHAIRGPTSFRRPPMRPNFAFQILLLSWAFMGAYLVIGLNG
jgi:hypothetical protein